MLYEAKQTKTKQDHYLESDHQRLLVYQCHNCDFFFMSACTGSSQITIDLKSPWVSYLELRMHFPTETGRWLVSQTVLQKLI